MRRSDEDAEARRLSLERYLANAPPGDALDELERRRGRGEIGLVRQEKPGIYTFVVDGQLQTMGGKR